MTLSDIERTAGIVLVTTLECTPIAALECFVALVAVEGTIVTEQDVQGPLVFLFTVPDTRMAKLGTEETVEFVLTMEGSLIVASECLVALIGVEGIAVLVFIAETPELPVINMEGLKVFTVDVLIPVVLVLVGTTNSLLSTCCDSSHGSILGPTWMTLDTWQSPITSSMDDSGVPC